MKKLLAGIICLIIALSFCGCTPNTDYDEKEISKIETTVIEGFPPFPRKLVRTFDFKSGKVCDTMIADKQYIQETDAAKYNTPIEVTSFTSEKAQAFIDEVKSLGFYTWQDEYVTTDAVHDAGNETVTVYFADGTVKSTLIYCIDPPKYDEINEAFKAHLGANMYLGF